MGLFWVFNAKQCPQTAPGFYRACWSLTLTVGIFSSYARACARFPGGVWHSTGRVYVKAFGAL